MVRPRRAGRRRRRPPQPRAAAARASSVTLAQSPDARASAGVSHEPPTQPTFDRARYDGAVAAVIPPVGQNRAAGTGAAIDFRNAAPPDASAGKNFSSVQPASSTASTSETVAVPGRNGSPVSAIAPSSDGVEPGDTRNCAPASRASFAWPGVTIVPAPTRISGTSAAIARIASSATGVRRVSSTTGSPPATRARATGTACAGSSTTTTGTTGTRESSEDSDGVDNGHLLRGDDDAGEDAGAGVGAADGRPEGREQLAS